MSSPGADLPPAGQEAAPAGDSAGLDIAGNHGVWVYAVAESIAPDWLSGITGVGGNPVRVVAAGGLAAAVTTVSLAAFGEEALRRNLEDLAWLEAVARIHHDVIEALARHRPAVPMRLATVYRSDARLAATLEHRREDFTAALGRVAGRTEWGVKVSAPRPPAGGEPAGSDHAASRPGGGQQPPEGGAAGGPGAAFLRRRRAQLAGSRNAAQAALATAERIHVALGQLAAGYLLRPPQDPQLTGRPERMVLNAAYLVDDGSSARFAAEVESLASQHPELRVELTGPWPPYSFAFTGDDPAEPGSGAQPVPGRGAAL